MSLLDDAQALTVHDLIDPLSRDFSYNNWESVLDNVRCFRVIGLEPALRAHGITHAHIFQTKEYFTTALANVPAAWPKSYPTKDKGWKNCKKDQFSYAFNMLPIRFDKACTCILTACAALDSTGIRYPNFFETVKIFPQLYFVDGFTHDMYTNFIKRTRLENEILKRMNFDRAEQLENVALGHRITKNGALVLLELLKPAYGTRNVSRYRKKPDILIDEVFNYDPVAGGGPSSTAAAGPAPKKP